MEELKAAWQAKSEEKLQEVIAWHAQHPQATMREIEAEIDKRLSELRAQMITDTANHEGRMDWEAGSGGMVCPKCGEKLVKKGKKPRTLQTQGGQAIVLEREYGVCPKCGEGIFPPG